MGIQSPVTRQVVSGNLYYEELARELSQFLETRVLVKPDSAIEDDLGIQHNVILMSDLYCIFNRARGTELVSPDDLLKACLLLEPLQLRARLHKFEGSGVSYVTSEKYSDEVIIKRLVELLKKRGPMTTAQLATSQKISAPLAQQYMKVGGLAFSCTPILMFWHRPARTPELFVAMSLLKVSLCGQTCLCK
jgi:ESCRT-II complex subunit VPS36